MLRWPRTDIFKLLFLRLFPYLFIFHDFNFQEVVEKTHKFMQVLISSKTTPLPPQILGRRLERGKNPPPGTVIVYKTPPPRDKTGSQKPHPRDIKLENFTNISMNSDTIRNESFVVSTNKTIFQ